MGGTLQRIVGVVVVAACSGTPGTPGTPAAPTAVGSASSAAPVPDVGSGSAGDAAVVAQAAPPRGDWSPPADVDLVATLLAQDFVPAFAASTDEANFEQAQALNVEGLKLHAKQRWSEAEAKYLAALRIDPGHMLARYNLACVYNRDRRSPQALALLAELARAGCGRCVRRAAWDDDWQSQFGEPVFWDVLDLEPTQATTADDDTEAETEDDGDAPVRLRCPRGTKQVGTWRDDRDDNEIWCARGAVRHGPYRLERQLYDEGEGRMRTSGAYRDGVEHGPWHHDESIGPSGSDGAYLDGKQHGVWHTFERESSARGGYVKGVPVGTELSWDGDGELIGEVHFVDGKAEGTERTWGRDVDGTYFLRKQATYERGARVREIEYDGPGQVSSEGSFAGDKQIGRWTQSEAGVLRSEATYVDGALHGTRTVYDAKGRKTAVTSWDHGVRHGRFEYWHDGKPLGKTTMEHGTGDWIAYVDGQLVERGRLINGVRDGAWMYYDDRSWEWSEGAYAAGKRTGAWTHATRDDRNKIEAAGAYVDDKRHGAWTLRNHEGNDGVIVAKGAYVGGILDGTWTIYRGEPAPDDEPAQTIVFRKAKLVKVDGERATKAYQRSFDYVPGYDWEPRVLEEQEAGPFDE